MMKTMYVLALVVLIYNASIGQNINKEFIDTNNQPYLWGEINKEGLTNPPYADWFSKNYSQYTIAPETIQNIPDNFRDYSITIFMGTWCGDSKRQVPPFLKILDSIHFPENQLKIIAVGRDGNTYKQGPNHEEEGLNIHRVPTILFYKNGIEQNRIVESPVETLEKDLLTIATYPSSYVHNYQIVSAADSLLQSGGLKAFKKGYKKILQRFENKVPNAYELNTYAYILLITGKKEQSIAVCKLNTDLFPNLSFPYQSLADKLEQAGKKRKALLMYKKALELNPDDEKLAEKIKLLSS